MKPNSTAQKLCMAFVCLALILGACKAPNITTPPSTDTPSVETPTPTASFAHSTPTLMLTALPSFTPSPSLTSTLLPTSTPMPPTWTPLPTLPPDEANAMVLKLLKDNGGCKLPCWWGITPGKTMWHEAQQFLDSFVEVTPDSSTYGDEGKPTKIFTYLIGYPLKNQGGRGGFSVYVKNDQIVLIFVGKDSTIHNSLLDQILTNYGRPDNIYIRTFDAAPGDDFPLTLVLAYIEKKFLVAYFMSAYAKDDELISCPRNEKPVLWVWAPEEVVTEQRIQDWTLGVVPIIPLKPIEEVTDLDAKSFTEIFSTTNDGSNCLRTNKSFWNVEP